MSKAPIPLGISARHLHVSKEDLAILYGEGHELHCFKPVGQPGQFAAEEFVDLVTEKSEFKKVRIIGPIRKETQVEVSLSDAMKMGLKAPVRDSGDVAGTPGIKIVGPKGTVELKQGVIVAKRHVHMTPADAVAYGVKEKDLVQVKVGGDDRCLIFDKVLVRVGDNMALEMHIDTDEANAAMAKNNEVVDIIK